MLLFRLTRVALALLGSLALCGCAPSGSGRSVEEKEPHFLAGRARVNAMDFTGAIEEFGKALLDNPRSAQAHFELGWLYAEKNPDAAAAIYHYEQYLKLRPDAGNAETIKQHIFRLKQELAKAVWPLPPTPGAQRDLDQLAEQNRQMREENVRLREEVEKWRAYYAGHGATSGGVTPPPTSGAQPGFAGGGSSSPTPVRPTSGATTRMHKVQADETPIGIARKYGVRLDALMAVNPGLNPKRMQIGQQLNIPAP